jgi:hypothetical protein
MKKFTNSTGTTTPSPDEARDAIDRLWITSGPGLDP